MRCCPHDQGPLEIFQPKLVCSINAVQLTLDGFPRPSSCQNISIVAPEPRLVIRPRSTNGRRYRAELSKEHEDGPQQHRSSGY